MRPNAKLWNRVWYAMLKDLHKSQIADKLSNCATDRVGYVRSWCTVCILFTSHTTYVCVYIYSYIEINMCRYVCIYR